MKKSLLSLILSLFLFGQSFGQWQKANLPANNAILSLTVDYATSYVYAGSAGNGVYLSVDTGDNWSTTNTGLPTNLNVWNILIQNKNIFLATNDGVYSSANYGTSWQQSGLKGVLVKSLTFNNADSTLYAGTEKGIYLSKNDELSWALYAFPNQGVSTLFMNGVAFYAGMTAGGLNYYTDYRKIWAAADTGITNKTIVKTINNYGYYGFAGLNEILNSPLIGTDHGVYIEKSKGNWVQVNNGLGPDTIVNSIISAFDMYNQGYNPIYFASLIVTGKDTGNVYSHHNPAAGYYWSSLNTGIDGSVNTLAMYRNIIFAGGSSLWVLKSDLKYLYASNITSWTPAVGDTTTFKLFTNNNDFWFIQTTNDWLTFSPNTGTGDATITVTVAPNNTNSMRFGFARINASGTMLSIYQDAANTTGIENASNTNIIVYPVPVTDELVISFPNQPNNVRYSIYNLSGMELLASQLTGSNTKVNMNGFKPGVYVLKIYSGNTCTAQKIIKQ